MVRLSIIIWCFLLVACNTATEKNQKEKIFHDSKISWIGDGKEQPEKDSLFYLDNPTPIFRKEFKSEKKVNSARLRITAAGYYKASINGERVGKNMLDPAWTDYSKRIFYSEYDVTDMVEAGENCMGVVLGNGFYNPLPLRMWGRRNLREPLTVGRPVFIASIQLEYENGKKDVIITDDSWSFSYGPILKNNVYLGEVYDARREIDGWDKTGFDDSSWEKAKLEEGPGGEIQKTFFPPIQITERIQPEDIYLQDEGTYIVDMGVNFAGVYRIKLKGDPGDSIVIRSGERVYSDGSLNPMTAVCGQIKSEGVGGPGAPDTALQEDIYIIGSDTEAWFKPEFTYHTFRYLEVNGLDKKPEIQDVEGLALNSTVTNNNSFSTSSGLINSIQEMTERTFLSNLHSVQQDCPAREKFGYGGDLNATSEAYIYNFDMQSFYRKTVYDWVDAMNDSGFVDTAPFVGIQYCGLSWESAMLITQYYLYLYYNDTEFIREMYEINNDWMDKVARIHPEGLVNSGLSDHGSMEPVPVKLTGTCHYLQCARIMQEFASVMNDQEKQEKYEKLAAKLKGLIQCEFWDKPVKDEINRQTLHAFLLYHDIVPQEDIDAARDSLLNAVQNGPAGHFNTGIFGTKYITEVLSEHISPEFTYNIVNSTEFPGWGYMIDNGATTIWETWKESDNTFSNCHPMFGSVSEWFYSWLAGIKPNPEHPGFEKFYLAPSTPQELDHVNCTYHSPHGKIVSNWERDNNKRIYQMEIPSGTAANVVLPLKTAQNISIKKSGDPDFKPGQVDGLESGRFELSEGKYTITIK
ncbi:MAG: family 78 glycoside hydrolase catalytic domain [Bacteroidales bacterium]